MGSKIHIQFWRSKNTDQDLGVKKYRSRSGGLKIQIQIWKVQK